MAQEANMQANGMSGHRQSEIELLRIVAMLMVLLLHVNFLTFGEPDAQSVNIAPINSFLLFIKVSILSPPYFYNIRFVYH